MNADFKISGIQLETERLILRSFKLSDLDDFFEYASVEGVGERAGWLHHKDKEESLKILKMFIEEDKTFAICLKENDKVIGSLGIEFYNLEDKLSEFNNYQGREIGYVLSKDYWGKGLMPEAVRKVIEYLFNELNYCIKELNNKIDEYNNFVENYKEIKINLQKYNNFLSGRK